MKHKSRFLLPILTFLTFGMVTGSVVAETYAKDTVGVEEAEAATTSTSGMYISFKDTVYNKAVSADPNPTDSSNQERWPWVRLENITFTDNYNSVTDVANTTGGTGIIGNYCYSEDDNKLNVRMIWNSTSSKYEVNIPWYITKADILFFVQNKNWNNNQYFLCHRDSLWKKTGVNIGEKLEFNADGSNEWGSHWAEVSGPLYRYKCGWTSYTHTTTANYKYNETTHSVTFSTTGNGSGTINKSSGQYKNRQRVSITASPADSSNFGGWSDSGSQTHIVMITGTSTYTATFTLKQFNVTYKSGGNGAEGADVVVQNQNYGSYTLKTPAQCSFVHHFAKFTGWKDASGNDYSAGQSITLTSALVLTAQWEVFPVYMKVGTADWVEMESEYKDGVGIRNCYSDGEVAQTQGTIVQFKYTDTTTNPATSHNITPSTYVGSYHNNGDNFGYNDDPCTFRYDNVTGYIDLQVFYTNSALEFKSWAHGPDKVGKDAGDQDETQHFDFIFTEVSTGGRDRYEFAPPTSANYQWEISNRRLKVNDIIRFSNAKTGYWYTPGLNASTEAGCFEVVTGDNEGIKCLKEGDYDLYIQSDTNRGDTFYAQRKTADATFNMQGKGTSYQPATQIVTKGSKVTNPGVTPRETNYVFAGWTHDAAGNTAWNFASDTISADTSIYAKWEEVEIEREFVGGTKFGVKYTIPSEYDGLYDTALVTAPNPNLSYISYDEDVEYDIVGGTGEDKTVTVPINSTHLSAAITLKLVDSTDNDFVFYTETESIEEMTEATVGTGTFNKDTKTDQNKLKAVLTYGAYSQLYFGTSTADLANSNIQDADKTVILTAMNNTAIPEDTISASKSNTPSFGVTGIAFSSSDGFTLKFVLNLKGASNCDHLNVTRTGAGSAVGFVFDEIHNYWYVEVKGITSAQIYTDTVVTISDKVGGGSRTISYSVGTYLYTVETTEEYREDTGLYNLCKAVNLLGYVNS